MSKCKEGYIRSHSNKSVCVCVHELTAATLLKVYQKIWRAYPLEFRVIPVLSSYESKWWCPVYIFRQPSITQWRKCRKKWEDNIEERIEEGGGWRWPNTAPSDLKPPLPTRYSDHGCAHNMCHTWASVGEQIPPLYTGPRLHRHRIYGLSGNIVNFWLVPNGMG